MGWERRCSGTHISKDFELQSSGIQVIKFPCKGEAQIREGSDLPGGCFPVPPLPLLGPHRTTRRTHILSSYYLGSACWYTSPVMFHLLYRPSPAPPGSALPGPSPHSCRIFRSWSVYTFPSFCSSEASTEVFRTASGPRGCRAFTLRRATRVWGRQTGKHTLAAGAPTHFPLPSSSRSFCRPHSAHCPTLCGSQIIPASGPSTC